MTRASIPTLLSLDRYARIMGIDPVHFAGAVGESIFPLRNNCRDVWWQRSYITSDAVSREDLAQAIATAEEDIADVLGYWPAPKWIAREIHMYPDHHRPDIFGGSFNVRGDQKSIKLRWGKFISPGRRYTGLIGTSRPVVWTDPDGDGFDELGTVTAPTTLTSASRQQVKAYFTGQGTEQEWEIRNPKSVTITGGNVIVAFDFWQLIDPALQDQFPTGTPTALNIDDPAIYVTTVDLWREYTDYSQHSAEFFWEPRVHGFCANCGGTSCAACTTEVQCGCLHVRDVNLGIAVPQPATWNVTDAEFTHDEFVRCEPPDQIKVWYYAGELSDRYLRLVDLDPLSNWWAETIAWLATARLERNFCNCGALTALAQELRMDTSRADANGPTWLISEQAQDNPFGTRNGEVRAWRRVMKLAKRIPTMALV